MGGGRKMPTNQKRHTNIAVVKLQSHGKRFEIACYPNKVISWRDGVEKDLREVLQSERVFTNVGKGEFSNSKDLEKAFGTKNEKEICKIILEKGALQVGEKERGVAQDSMFAEIAEKVSEMSINTETDRKYPPTIIQKAMRDEIHYSIQSKKNAKVQAIDVIKQLQKKKFPIDRCKSKVKIFVPKEFESTKKKIIELAKEIVLEQDEEIIMTILPSQLRQIQELFEKETEGKATCELITLNQQKNQDEILK